MPCFLERSSVPSAELEAARKDLIAKTKENIVIRRHWSMEGDALTRVYAYVHSNNKLAALISLRAKDETQANSPEFAELGESVACQIAAMAPLALSIDKLTPEQVSRQKAIFETQVKEMGKPEPSWPKIIDGKMNKWYQESVLMEQTSIDPAHPKKKVKDLLNGATITSFERCVVGEGIVVEKADLAAEVKGLIG